MSGRTTSAPTGKSKLQPPMKKNSVPAPFCTLFAILFAIIFASTSSAATFDLGGAGYSDHPYNNPPDVFLTGKVTNTSGANSGPVRLELWACPSITDEDEHDPPVGSHRMATYGLGTIQGGCG